MTSTLLTKCESFSFKCTILLHLLKFLHKVSYLIYTQKLRFFLIRSNNAGTKKTLPEELRCDVQYHFLTSSLVLCFSDSNWDWSRVSLSGSFKALDQNVLISEDSFECIEKGFWFTGKQKFSQVFRTSFAKIERSVVAKRFNVKLGYMFLEDPNMQHFSTEYFFDVSFCTNDNGLSNFLRIHFFLSGAGLQNRDSIEIKIS